MTHPTLDEWIARDAIPVSLGSPDTAIDQIIASLGDSVELLGFGEALHGSGRLVFLGGEAGVGKTALAAALAEAAGGPAVRRGCCDIVTTAEALGPILDALPELARAVDLAAGASTNVSLDPTRGIPLRDFVVRQGATFQTAAQQRQYAFGNDNARWIDLSASNLAAISFVSQIMATGPNQRGFLSPPGLDLTPAV